ncbi:MAG: chromosomal replication initiator protein DnaA [Christensenellales bacterium]
MKELQDLWKQVLNKIEIMVSAVSFELWIEPLEVLDFPNAEKLIVVANTEYAKKQLLKRHNDQLQEAVHEVFGDNVAFEVLDPIEKKEYLKKNKPDANKAVISKEEEHQNSFNPKYTFDNFVVGKCNQIVYAAAHSVAENPGKRFNPLFIYGGVGLGKTHLLHAIGNYIASENPDLKIKYVTCEQFTNDYINSLHGSAKELNINKFREKYRLTDVLMVDDIQFISNKNETQEEFFHTFNDLFQNNKQIIIASDRPPKDIATLSDRLKSRFASGFIQDMQIPDFETRVAILRKKAQLEKYSIDDEVINFIAEKVDTNIREMEGLLTKVYFFATLLGKKTATLEEAKEAFKEDLDEKRDDLSPETIINAVCKYFSVSKADLVGKKKNKEIVEPRMIAIYLTCELLDLPLVVIGKTFGGRDHTTIIHAREKITEQIKENGKIKSLVGAVKEIINNDNN